MFQTSIQDHTFVESPGADESEGSSVLCAPHRGRDLDCFFFRYFQGRCLSLLAQPRGLGYRGPAGAGIAPSPPRGRRCRFGRGTVAQTEPLFARSRDPPIVTRAPLT